MSQSGVGIKGGYKMALIKSKETEYGVMGEYWKISRFTVDTVNKEVFISFYLYINKEKADKNHLEDYTFSSPILKQEEWIPKYNHYFREDRGENYKDYLTACYEYAKDNIDFFKDAKDDE